MQLRPGSIYSPTRKEPYYRIHRIAVVSAFPDDKVERDVKVHPRYDAAHVWSSQLSND